MNKFRNVKGFTLLELIIALFMTSIVVTVGYSFYIKMSNQAMVQSNISEMQQNSRSTMHEIIDKARKAGYKVGNHIPYRFSNDTLMVFYNDVQPVDTFCFYLADYSDHELAQFNYIGTADIPRKLMLKHNSDPAVIYSDCIYNIQYATVDTSSLQITLVVQSSISDEDYARDDGVRYYTKTQQVNIRNANL